jgi:hypothetical protein
MAAEGSKKAAFESFGVTQRNERWSWSAQGADPKRVVGTFWLDIFEPGSNPRRYQRADFTPRANDRRPGLRAWIEDLDYAQSDCSGVVHIIEVERRASGRHRFTAKHDTVMRIISRDRDRPGLFVAVEEKVP